MEYIYGALLLHAAGKEITEDNVSSVLKAAGVKEKVKFEFQYIEAGGRYPHKAEGEIFATVQEQ